MFSACRESGTIQVKSLNFKGVKAVNVSDLKGALATRANSKFFWGKKHFFDRSQFENDLSPALRQKLNQQLGAWLL